MGRPKKILTIENTENEDRLAPPLESQTENTSSNVSEEPRLEAPVQAPSLEMAEDYLRQYQYRKQTVFGSKDSDPQPGSKADTMKKHLLSSPRVRMFIPRPEGEAKSILQSVTLNGYRLDLPKNTYIELPEPIYNVLKESLAQTEIALDRDRISGDKQKENALL